MLTFDAQTGARVEIPVVFGTTTGLDLGSLDTVLVTDGLFVYDAADFASTYDAELAEVSAADAPGVYLLSFTPNRVGAMFFRLVEGILTNEFIVESTLTLPPFVVDPTAEGDYLVTAKVGDTPIQGVTARIYDSLGTALLARGTTDSQGEVRFPLPAGSYQLRLSKVGYDFGAPSAFVVVPNDEVAPVLQEIVPSSASIGDSLALRGQAFHLTQTEVLFGATVVSPTGVSVHGTVVVVEVPVGLTDSVIPVRVRKPDPNNPGQYLLSGVVTFTRV